ncbi:ABC transporter permease [Chthonobacter albigriseus]|uniref:ABC transporter permease n=1 Tax=Chthonobacter albigriseus TaxID=1683161 RepID=UPI0015EE55C0|nr:ABC transporter permease subunit [Chthonobacter albigriseus]
MSDVPAPLELAPAEGAGQSLGSIALARLKRNKAAVTSLIILAFVAVVCFAGPWVYPHRYDEIFGSYVGVPPSLTPYPEEETLEEVMTGAVERGRVTLSEFEVTGSSYSAVLTDDEPIDERLTRYLDRPDEFDGATVASTADDGRTMTITGSVNRQYFPMGTDKNGRDLFARIMIGGQISLVVGLLATFVALVIGVVYGAASGYIGGKVDNVMMRLVEILYSLPFMFFVIMLVVFFGRHFALIFAAIGAIQWLEMARIVRGQTLSLKRREFVEAANAMGLSTWAIIRRHVIPNTIGPVVVFVTVLVPQVILLESFLSFLGLGVQEPLTSWGTLIAEGSANMQASPWLLIFPSVFFVVTLFALNFVGDGLRDALDPKDR